jgi:TPR repeat protein
VLYDTGRLGQSDFAQAAVWYQKAAEQGHPRAQLNLAHLYDAGQGVAKNFEQAATWYRRAADQREPQAEYAIGACYADGEGVPQDLIEAYKWISLAAAHGHTEADAFQQILAKKLSPDQLAKAKQLAEAALAASK